MAARLGLEPRLTGPEPVVLPLHHRANFPIRLMYHNVEKSIKKPPIIMDGLEDQTEIEIS